MTAGTFSPAPHLASAHPHDGDQNEPAFRTVQVDSPAPTTETAPPTPAMLFRLALSLRHDGRAAEADKYFRQSSRLLSEQYVNQRLRLRRPHVA